MKLSFNLLHLLFRSHNLYDDWDKRPVVTTVATTGLPISEIPFPSVTICSDGVLAETSLASFLRLIVDYLPMNNMTVKTTYCPKEMATAFMKLLHRPTVNLQFKIIL